MVFTRISKMRLRGGLAHPTDLGTLRNMDPEEGEALPPPLVR